MSTLKQLIAQQEALSTQIEEMRQHERARAIKSALELISEHQLTPQDLFGSSRKAKKLERTGGKVEPKYRDSATASTWSGRGMTPRWITESGKDKSHFLIVS